MNPAERDALRAQNDGLREQIEAMTLALDRQMADIGAAREKLATASTSAWSNDRLVRVTVNAAGFVTDVQLSPEAFGNSKPETLGRSITEAAQRAARQAQQATQETIAPITETTAELPDLPEIIPGAPSLRGRNESLLPGVPEPSSVGIPQPATAFTPPPAPRQQPVPNPDHYYPPDDDDGPPQSWLVDVR